MSVKGNTCSLVQKNVTADRGRWTNQKLFRRKRRCSHLRTGRLRKGKITQVQRALHRGGRLGDLRSADKKEGQISTAEGE